MFDTTNIALMKKVLADGIESLKKKGAYISSYKIFLVDQELATFHITITIDFPAEIEVCGIKYKSVDFDLFTPHNIWEKDHWQYLDKEAAIPTSIDDITRGVSRILWTVWCNTKGISFKTDANGQIIQIKEPEHRIKATMNHKCSAFELKPTTNEGEDYYLLLFR